MSFGQKGSLGKNVSFRGSVRLTAGENVTIRKNVIIGGHGNVTIEDDVTINDEVIISCLNNVHIGKDTMIAPRVYIIDVDHEFMDIEMPIRLQGYRTSPIIIEDDVWVGTGSVITRGTHIGKGSVIGANSVVRGFIPPYSIAVGIPARPVKFRCPHQAT